MGSDNSSAIVSWDLLLMVNLCSYPISYLSLEVQGSVGKKQYINQLMIFSCINIFDAIKQNESELDKNPNLVFNFSECFVLRATLC